MALGSKLLRSPEDLARFETRLRGKRRRLKIYWVIWLGFFGLAGLSSLDSSSSIWEAFQDVFPVVGMWGLLVSVFTLRVMFLHPRLLATHRRLMADLGRLPSGEEDLEQASDAGLLEDLRQVQHRLRRRCTGLGIHQSEFLGELNHGNTAVEKLGAELSASTHELAAASLRGASDDQMEAIEARRRNAWFRLEGYLAGLLACEAEAQMDNQFLKQRQALELLRQGQQLLFN